MPRPVRHTTATAITVLPAARLKPPPDWPGPATEALQQASIAVANARSVAHVRTFEDGADKRSSSTRTIRTVNPHASTADIMATRAQPFICAPELLRPIGLNCSRHYGTANHSA